MVKVILHGSLGKEIGEEWEFEALSVSEALRAIEVNTKKLRKWLITNKDNYAFEILVNKSNLFSEQPELDSLEKIKNSELCIQFEDKIQTIDIVPMIIGAGFWDFKWLFDNPVAKIVVGASAVVGAIALGVYTPYLLPAVALGIAGLGLIAAGTSALLSKPPPSTPFSAKQADPIAGASEGGATSYLFNGPVSTVGEGGPVPIGYGELIVGGNNVFSNYDILYRSFKTSSNSQTLQYSLEGTDSYFFNSNGFLAAQTPALSET
jgi:predicted phage tail protein